MWLGGVLSSNLRSLLVLGASKGVICYGILGQVTRRNSMYMSLLCLGWILMLITPSAVELSFWIGVLGCSCPNSSIIL